MTRKRGPEVEYVQEGELTINPNYQRPLKEKHIEAILERFKPHLVNPVRVYKTPDGTYEVIDGQHTLEVLRQQGWRSVPVFVLNGKTGVEEAAETFVELNTGRKALRPLEIFDASLTAKQPLAVELDKIVRSFGLRIATGIPGGIAAVRTLEKIYKSSGATALKDVLHVLTAAWDADDKRRLDGKMLGGMHLFLLNERAGRERIIERLKRTSPTDILRKAATIGGGGGSMDYRVADQIATAYRKRNM